MLTHPPNLQHTLTIQRQTGGLGISIAGGKGSTPYKGDDEVTSGVWFDLRNLMSYILLINSFVYTNLCRVSSSLECLKKVLQPEQE